MTKLITDKFSSLENPSSSNKKKIQNTSETGSRDSFLYVVKHRETGGCYIGKAIDPEKRWRAHKRAALTGSMALPHFYAALRAYGVDAFDFSIYKQFESEDAAFEGEILLIADFREHGIHLFNVSKGGRGGREFTLEQRRIHSEIQREWSNTPEARARNSEAQQNPQVRAKKSQRMKEVWASDIEYANAVRTKLQSEHNRQIHSDHQRSMWTNPEQRAKMIEGMNKPEVKEAQRKRTSNEGNPRAKLTWERVDAMRSDHARGMTTVELSEKYEVSFPTVRRVITNKAWVRS